MSQCKLCLQNKKLCESHIIPDFMYRNLFDEKHRLLKVSVSNWDKKYIQSGDKEELLCEHCDNVIIGQLECYAKKLLYDIKPGQDGIYFENLKNRNNVEFTYCKGVDYIKFKLFQLSLVWRASISKKPFFSMVNLGEKHGEKIREMIFSGSPGEELDYPCILFSYTKHKEMFPQSCISQPIKSRFDNGTTYVFNIGGLVFYYYISKISIPNWAHEVVLNKKNELRILHTTKDQAAMIANMSIGHNIF